MRQDAENKKRKSREWEFFKGCLGKKVGITMGDGELVEDVILSWVDKYSVIVNDHGRQILLYKHAIMSIEKNDEINQN